MKKILLYITFCFLAATAAAQTASPNVISTAGSYYTGAGITWSWTMGETVIPTYNNGTNIVSQGFQQPEVQIWTDTVANPFCAGSTFNLPFVAYSIIGANNVFTAQLSNSSGSFAAPTAVGTLNGNGTPIANNKSGTISVTIPNGTTPGTYRIRVVSSLPNFNTKDSGIEIIVVTSVTPTVTITPPANGICAGSSATFTANPSGGGATPAYQWSVNGTNAGTNSGTFSDANLKNGDVVKVVLTSDANCLSTPTASNTVTAVVTTAVTPTATISVAPGDTICAGTSVTFNANTTYPGTTPTYNWEVNGSTVSTTSSYTSAGLTNGEQVELILTSSISCVTSSTANSNTITMNVSQNVTPTVTISAVPGDSICAGTSVTFNANVGGGGKTPAYQWELNGNNVSAASTYTNAGLNNGDIVKLIITSNAACVTTSTANSNSITFKVIPVSTPTATVSALPGDSVCAGTAVTFSANVGGSGTTPTYSWELNGSPVGSGTTYTDANPTNGDQVQLVVTSTAACSTAPTVTSNSITLNVAAITTPSVTIAATPGDTICAGTTVTFNANAKSGGASPTYNWELNGNAVSSTATYSNTNLVTGDQVKLILTSNAKCVTTNNATSNTVTITVGTIGSAGTISATVNPVCEGTTTVLSVTGNIGNVQWQSSSTPSNFAPIPGATSATYTAAGLTATTYFRIVAGSGTCSDTSATTTITVNPSPVIGTISVSNSPICANNTETLSLKGSTGSIQWQSATTPGSFANISGANATSYTSAPLTSTIYYRAVTSIGNCTDTSTTETITVNPAPLAGKISTASDTICPNTVTSLAVKGATGSIQWQSASPGGSFSNVSGATSAAYNAVLLAKTTTYRVITTLGNCNDTSAAVTIVVSAAPVASFTADVNGLTSIFNSGGSTGAVKFYWDFGDTLGTSTQANPTYVYKHPGIYDVCLTVTNSTNCNFTSCSNVEVYPNGIQSISANSNLLVYPNPFSSQVIISANGNEEIQDVTVFDVLGRIVIYKYCGNSCEKPLQIDATNLTPGMYFVKIKANNTYYAQKLIKE